MDDALPSWRGFFIFIFIFLPVSTSNSISIILFYSFIILLHYFLFPCFLIPLVFTPLLFYSFIFYPIVFLFLYFYSVIILVLLFLVFLFRYSLIPISCSERAAKPPAGRSCHPTRPAYSPAPCRHRLLHLEGAIIAITNAGRSRLDVIRAGHLLICFSVRL